MRGQTTLILLWIGAPCAVLAVFAGEWLPASVFLPAHAFAAFAVTLCLLALFAWPAFAGAEPPRAEALRALTLLALSAPLAVACARLGGVAIGEALAAAFLCALYLGGGSVVRRAGPVWTRVYLALAVIAVAGLPLLGYLIAELAHGDPRTLLLASPVSGVWFPVEPAGVAPLWAAHAAGYLACVGGLFVAARPWRRPA